MSFLAGRLAGKEGAYFFQESKQAVSRLAQKNSVSKNLEGASSTPAASLSAEQETGADVLPEVLRHSLPSKIFKDQQLASDSSSLSTSKWVLHSDPKNGFSVSPDALNPLRAYVSLPQVTFGPKRWELPSTEHSFSASTANDLRQDRHIPVNPEKLKAAAEGLAHVGKAFAVATAIIFGGAALVFGMVASKLELHNIDDLRSKGKDLVEPKFDNIREQLVPLKTWAEDMSRKWHLERDEDYKQKPIIKELSKILGAKTSN
ncbi:Coiled-coil protein [Quillaja saponaria]|uniref:Coiled-coil protein n=1 Tax=Quillaja saponaria TaxID=32244 RepID=A0AAD7LLG9_QUISA|nr:Coiled-coil protein [Quillaja saponaria]